MKSLYKIVTVTVFLSLSYLSLAENNNIKIDTNKKTTNKCFIFFDNHNKCTPTNTITHDLPTTEQFSLSTAVK